ncbi:putative mitochondrial carrier C8C9.12c [Auxenochlorella protothecoides]|uniref:Putative mitochondrial carrier C8C9.12c n=1 Tax=Auxenochlorella protothecoides TaxID=3075 RepID=A0A087SAR1_AUXPR|nr:putative mitochondrial carrier C8C9.12c [Auxenochlorella protothecoides]KFM22815.1 putative mitochondrial carrier C8C9.12c [Auxenochlorella protothecoides]
MPDMNARMDAEASISGQDDGESVYDGLPFYQHMMAGALAGIGEHVVMFPVDTIKTRMQALAHPGQQLHLSVRHAMRAVLRREGVAGLYRGVTAMALGAGPGHALYFATYEKAKHLYGGNRKGHQLVATAGAGATATIVNDACMTPWDVVKQRMQVSHSPYRNIFHCAKSTYRHEGLSAFYRSYWTTLVMNVPYTALQFMLYESSKKLLVGEGTADEEEEGLKVQFVAGGIAGGTAAAATTPLDVVKTRLQLEGLGSATRYQTMSVIPVMRRIAGEEGAAALWSGWRPRVLFNAPAAAICWGVYETCKTFLAGDDVADQA